MARLNAQKTSSTPERRSLRQRALKPMPSKPRRQARSSVGIKPVEIPETPERRAAQRGKYLSSRSKKQ